jgi:hypothetical protein
VEHLRREADETRLIADLAINKAKRETFAKLADHLNALADEDERAMLQGRSRKIDHPRPCSILLAANLSAALSYCARTSRAFQSVMAKGLSRSRSRFVWSMQHDRELIVLVKAHTPLQTIAKKLDRPVTTIIRRTARLGLSIERVAKARK